MHRPAPPTAEQLLQRTREQILAVLAGVALLIIGIFFGLHVPLPLPLRQLQGVGAVLAVVVLFLAFWNVFRYRALTIGVSVLLVGLHLAVIHELLLSNQPPTLFIPWMLLFFLGIFIAVGRVIGALLALTLVAGVLALLLLIPLPAKQTFDWVIGLMTFSGLCLVSYLLMKFVEDNLLLHAETTDRLRAARLDALTGIFGRAATEEELQRSINHAKKTNTPLSILVTDIDHFKQVNDQYGHATGDDVLRAFAKRLRRNVGGSGGTVGRWGGEEFVVILPGMARPDAFAMAERLRHEVGAAPVASVPITASFGLASLRGPADDLDLLFARADERLYEAKNAGRNMVK